MVAIGIDLGTTYSCVGVFRNGKVDIIANDQGDRTTPSYVAFDGDKRFIGSPAKAQWARNLKNTVYDAKRLIGRHYTDNTVQNDINHMTFDVVNQQGQPAIAVQYMNATKTYRPEEISSMILAYLKEVAEQYLGEPVKDAVITVPAYFNDSQRQATKDAGSIAGLNVLRIINEPTAAALAYGLDKSLKDENILIFDLGGGTFDVSILNIGDGVFTVLATGGNTHLGGEDFDNIVTEFLANEFNRLNNGLDIKTSKRSMMRLQTATERAKRTLSASTSATIEIDGLFEARDFTYALTRAKFEQLCANEFKKCLTPVESVLRDSGLDKSKIHEIVMVGGSTRIPKIQTMISDFFGGKKLNHSIHPDEAVAYGAAVQAANLTGDSKLDNLLLIDVAPLSLGVETEGGLVDVLIPRQTSVPTKKTKIYSTASHNQPGVTIQVYEGERPMTRDNNKLGEFTLDGLPPMPRGRPQIEVTFDMDTNGILHVSAVEKSTGKEQKIQIRNEKGRLSQEDIDKKIREAEQYKEQDQKNVAQRQARQQFEQYLYSVESSVESMTGLSDEDKETLRTVQKEGFEWLGQHPEVDPDEVQVFQKSLEARIMPIYERQGTTTRSAPEKGSVVEEVD